MKEIKAKIEALIHCKALDLDSLSKHTGIAKKGLLKNLINELIEEYKLRESGLKIINRDGKYKISVRDEHVDTITEAARPEIDKAVLETLAYIAHKKMIRQADVVRIRSNKSYNHIKELVGRGFIESKKDGRSKKLTPTRKFYEYFKLPENEEI